MGVIAHVLIGKVGQTSVVGFTYTAITIFKSVLLARVTPYNMDKDSLENKFKAMKMPCRVEKVSAGSPYFSN